MQTEEFNEVPNIEQHILSLEKEYWQCLIDQDADGAWGMTNDPCVITGANGIGKMNRKDFVSMMRNSNWVLNGFEITDALVEVMGPYIAVIAYKVKEELAIDGKPITVEAYNASTWIKKADGWVCALHTESIQGDPYGRDRFKVFS